ncbi:AAA family ATPase [Neobacillus sp. CF12]|uniref:AAA family ATPase n=1 Tax=Neobacillus sp. CF12 TaxID=3055864 RepID=UPI0025A2908C|nr:AAA family ATPase [Neobacillus sp. CF12]MDM5330444.1 AAA family ATPase [Neobacillus sp. CF12]
MQKVIYTVGIPGSGKSHLAQKLAKKENLVILSTDGIRQQLFGDAGVQKSRIVYRVLFERLNELVAAGKSVVVDSTNIERERRMFNLSKLKNVRKECYYLDTPFEICLKRNVERKRNVEYRIMEKYRKNLEFPMLGEGFDDIQIIHTPSSYDIAKEDFIDLVENKLSYEELFERLKHMPPFSGMYRFNQENPHHQFLLCEHTYLVYEYISETYEGQDKLALVMAALFHDAGKPVCKVYKPMRGSYSYYAHENVSAQLACHFLTELGFKKEFVLKVVNLVQLHMLISFGGDRGASEIYHLIGEEELTKLYFFREADGFGK